MDKTSEVYIPIYESRTFTLILSFHISDLPRHLGIVDTILAFFFFLHITQQSNNLINCKYCRKASACWYPRNYFSLRQGQLSAISSQTYIALSDSPYHLVLQLPFSTELIEEKCFNVQYEDRLFQYTEAALFLYLTFG